LFCETPKGLHIQQSSIYETDQIRGWRENDDVQHADFVTGVTELSGQRFASKEREPKKDVLVKEKFTQLGGFREWRNFVLSVLFCHWERLKYSKFIIIIIIFF
jgi:hypothetical protein